MQMSTNKLLNLEPVYSTVIQRSFENIRNLGTNNPNKENLQTDLLVTCWQHMHKQHWQHRTDYEAMGTNETERMERRMNKINYERRAIYLIVFIVVGR